MSWKLASVLLLQLAAWAARENCQAQILARPYNKEKACLGDWQPVGCNPYTSSCPAADTYAVDQSGQCFYFRDLCIPTGFTRVDDVDAGCPTPGTPLPNCP